MTAVSVNRRAWELFGALCADAEELRLDVSRGPLGETLVDAGAAHAGGIAAGLRIAEICTGGLAKIGVAPDAAVPRWPWAVSVASSNPVVACLASQYAGWSLADGDFFALGSGPARALARQEAVFADIAYADEADCAVLVLEAGAPPPAAIVARVADACRVSPQRLGIVFAPTQSLAGSVQVVARVLEVALHKTHELHFPLDRVVDGFGCAPIPPPHPDFITAMGRTNDAIIFAGRVHLFVRGPAEDAQALAHGLPAAGSRDYGRPFAEIFRAAKGDFYAIDKSLFSPAEAVVTAIDSGDTFHAGRMAPDLLDASFA